MSQEMMNTKEVTGYLRLTKSRWVVTHKNPLGIQGYEDLTRKEVRFINGRLRLQKLRQDPLFKKLDEEEEQ